MNGLIDEGEIRRALAIMIEPGSVFEIRALDAKLSGNYRPVTISGYFDNDDSCIAGLQNLTSFKGTYFTLNPVQRALLARRENRLDYAEKNALTSDQHVVRRRWLPIDVDFDRPSGISTTDEEKTAANKKAHEIYHYLKARGWPDPVVGDSGNNYHLLYRIDLPCQDDGLVEKVLTMLADCFDGDGVKLDRAVHNQSRVVRLYGTLACKGDDIKERPHRLSKLLKVPDTLQPVSREQLHALVDELQPDKPEKPKVVPASKSTAWSGKRKDGKPDKEQIREMLVFIPKRPDYGDWITLVAAVGDALPEADAIEVLKDWSPEEEPEEYLKKLHSDLKHIHVGTLIHIAKQHGWTPPKSVTVRANEGETDLTSLTSFSSYEADYPAPLDEAAFYGLAGAVVRRILPETEADPAALLFTLLTGFGNMIGRTAYMMADGARHHLNLYSVTVGRTSIARKGTAWMRVKPVLKLIEEDWVKNNVEQGLSSGEGVIHRIRNKIDEEKPIRQKGRWTGEYETVTVDPGIDDKRLLVLETEFCSPLKVMNREGNTLSPVLRAAWDGDDLGTLTKNSRERATEPHFSMLGHITREELRRSLNETEAANGFGNRNIWVAAKRSKTLPKGGAIPPIADFFDPLQDALLFAHTCGELRRDDEAEELWAQVYPELSEGKPGLLGAITARAAPQILRISGLYAVFDCSPLIRVPHLKAALACWRYAENSARWIFQTGTGNKNADKILAALRVAGKKGLTKWEITADVFNRNATKFEIDEALRLLHSQNLARCEVETTATKPAERWFPQARPYEEYEVSAKKGQTGGDSSYSSCPPASKTANFGKSEATNGHLKM
jgi:hypothetical protein